MTVFCVDNHTCRRLVFTDEDSRRLLQHLIQPSDLASDFTKDLMLVYLPQAFTASVWLSIDL